VLFTTEEEQRRARGSFWGYQYNGRTIAYGTADVPTDEDLQRGAIHALLPNLGGRSYLLFLSRIHPKKGCDLLVRAFAACAAGMANVDLVIAGPDQVGWKKELQLLASSLGIAERVHWPGMLTGPAKWGAFRGASAFVLPSHQENFGIVVAEAMSCGLPVLVTNKVNTWREVDASGSGFVENDDLEGVERLIRRFVDLPAQEKLHMSRRARQCFLEKFNVEASAHDLLRVITEAVAVRTAGNRH
jgi:glycosyltransferase involved in cell wall biosynthesis